MSGTDKKNKESTENRALWLRSQATEVPDDAAERFLDLAAFADARLEGEEAERVAALLAADPDAASDVAAARSPRLSLADDIEIARVIARACALVPPPARGRGRVLPFLRPTIRLGAVRGVAEWASLAAAAPGLSPDAATTDWARVRAQLAALPPQAQRALLDRLAACLDVSHGNVLRDPAAVGWLADVAQAALAAAAAPTPTATPTPAP